MVSAPGFSETITWRLATIAPKNIGWSKRIQELTVPYMENATDGNLRIKWFWNGILGTEEDYIEKMETGQIDGMVFSGRGMTLACPETAVLQLPFLFESFEEVDHIRKIFYQDFEDLMAKRGYRLLFWADQDFDQIYSLEDPIQNESDFVGKRFLVWTGTIEEEMLKNLGAYPVVMEFSKAARVLRNPRFNIDACIAPALWIIGSQTYTKMKYMNTMLIRYSPGGILLKKEAWDALPENYRKNIMEVRDEEVHKYCRLLRVDRDQSIRALVHYGIEKVETPAGELRVIKERLKDVWDQLAGRQYPKSLLMRILKELEAFRNPPQEENSSMKSEE